MSAVGVETGTVLSATGCPLEYRLYRPPGPAADGLVVLAHGFLRSQERMEGLARALAQAGLTTATVDFCNMRPWDGGHYQNGLDLTAVAGALDARRVLYAGFSAGGLAALVAGERDPDAVGVLALDLVDAGGLGLRTARGLNKPLVGLMGEPTGCNAGGNGLPVFAASPLGDVRTVPGAGHCDFESPTDWLCQLVCEQPQRADQAPRAQIVAETVDAAAVLLGAGRGEAMAAVRAEAPAAGR
jgi:pimeloyl-ACP methyl ester carboxylesterase